MRDRSSRPGGPAGRHRRVARAFGELVSAAPDWDAPTPVAGWVARDVVGHLVEWLPAFLSAGGVDLPAAPSPATDPVGAWEAQAVAVQALLDDPSVAHRGFTHPHAGSHRLADAIDRFYTTDVFLHSWDLARATDQEPPLDPVTCAELLAQLEPIEPMLRASGQYGPRVPLAADDRAVAADPVTRLIAFIGRDPTWVSRRRRSLRRGRRCPRRARRR